MIRLGVALMVLGGMGKMAINTYRKIKTKHHYYPGNMPSGFYKGGFASPMTRREAQLILGIREGAPIEELRNKHRRVMLANHPDNGGSTFLATKVNEAKDLLSK